MTHVHRHRVRHYEADAQGFLFNSRYLELADVAMTEYFRRLGFPYRDLVAGGVDPSVASARLDFMAPARFEDVLDLDVRCEHVGRSSFTLTTTISRASSPVARTTLVYVNVDAVTASSRSLTAEVAGALRQQLTTPDEPPRNALPEETPS